MAKKEPKEKSKHPFRDAIEIVVFAVVMALGLKVFAIEAYQIPTGSMMPTLMGTPLSNPNGGVHDRVLVNKLSFLTRDPERWEVVVFRYPLAAHTNYVKRLVGLPDETLRIQHGDIWTKPIGAPDSEYQIARKPKHIQKNLWKRCWPSANVDADTWTGWKKLVPEDGGRSRERAPGTGVLALEAGTPLVMTRPIVDSYMHGYPDKLDGRLSGKTSAGGPYKVRDLKMEVTVTPTAASPLELDFVFAEERSAPEAPRTFCRLVLDAAAGEARLRRPDGTEVTQALSLPTGKEVDLEIAWWDQQLAVRIDGAQDVSWFDSLAVPTFPSRANRVEFAAPQGGWSVAPPTLWRDIHYLKPNKSLPDGRDSFDIPEGMYFMMGDNTQDSHDSRDWEVVTVPLPEPIGGWSELRGDAFTGSVNPFTNNPRWNVDRTEMTFREEHGDMFSFPYDWNGAEQLLIERAPFVPRESILGKPLAVFLPIPPFSPVWRMEVVW